MPLAAAQNLRNVRSIASTRLGVSALLLFGGIPVFAQMPMADSAAPQKMSSSTDQDSQMAEQITELRAQVARLQAAVQKTGSGKKVNSKSNMKLTSSLDKGMSSGEGEMGMAPGKSSMAAGSPSTGGMGEMGGEGEMSGMSPGGNAPMSPGTGMAGDKGEMGGMAGKGSPASAMGMCCMGKKESADNAGATPSGSGGIAGMSGASSAMPGQAGTSHLYHIGSNGFFLNHSRHITLTEDQRLTLTRLKDKAMLENTQEQRKIALGELELYTLTGADQPDNSRIQSKVLEIETMRAEQRINFIHAVADASNVLTPEQRKALLGTMTASKN